MVAVFGHKLDGMAVNCLVWQCEACSKTKPSPQEKRRIRAERWAQWKRDAIAGGMTQEEIDKLETSLQRDKERIDGAIKRGQCPDCGAPLGEKPDFAGRDFTNVFCLAPKGPGECAHFLVGVDNDELREMRAS